MTKIRKTAAQRHKKAQRNKENTLTISRKKETEVLKNIQTICRKKFELTSCLVPNGARNVLLLRYTLQILRKKHENYKLSPKINITRGDKLKNDSSSSTCFPNFLQDINLKRKSQDSAAHDLSIPEPIKHNTSEGESVDERCG